jgi:hypothetical protein
VNIRSIDKTLVILLLCIYISPGIELGRSHDRLGVKHTAHKVNT